jgi:hypothetical protein
MPQMSDTLRDELVERCKAVIDRLIALGYNELATMVTLGCNYIMPGSAVLDRLEAEIERLGIDPDEVSLRDRRGY